MTYKFDETPDLGGVVSSIKPFCKLLKTMPVPTEKDIVGDFYDPKYPGLAGRKWSRLCGFTFKSNKNDQYFQFVFVPKLKGSFSRNQKALSGWYCWTLFSNDKDNKQVTSIAEMKKMFGFDVNKFVHSDLFDKYVSAFRLNIFYALNHQVQELIDSKQKAKENCNELLRHVKAVKDSVGKLLDVQQYVTADDVQSVDDSPDYAKGSAPKLGHAKIAYNADKTYDLRNLDKNVQNDELRKRAIDKIANALSLPKKDEPKDVPSKDDSSKETAKPHVKYDPSLKYKFGGGRTKKADSEIFDKYDDYDNDDFR